MKHGFSAKTITLLITLGAVVGGVYVYGLMYLNEGKARIEILAKDVNKAKVKSEEVAAIRQALDEFKSYQEVVETHLVSPDGIVSFVEEIERVAKEAGVVVKIDSLDEGEAEPKSTTVGRLRLGFTVRGTWEEVVRFSALLDGTPYQVFVLGATFATDKTSGEETKKRLWVAGWSVSVPKLKEVKGTVQ